MRSRKAPARSFLARRARLAACLAGGWVAASLAGGCMRSPEPGVALGQGFTDDFDRESLGSHYKAMGGSWRIADGALVSHGDKNVPLWLDVKLPQNVEVSMTVWSDSPAVDTKLEIFGDGVRHESGYIVIFGGWKNTITTIARLDEHERTRKETRRKWKRGQRYEWTVRRQGNVVEFLVDGESIVSYDDPAPLVGPLHDRLAFTNWDSEVHYDNLRITPL